MMHSALKLNFYHAVTKKDWRDLDPFMLVVVAAGFPPVEDAKEAFRLQKELRFQRITARDLPIGIARFIAVQDLSTQLMLWADTTRKFSLERIMMKPFEGTKAYRILRETIAEEMGISAEALQADEGLAEQVDSRTNQELAALTMALRKARGKKGGRNP
jgi:hypothetical protein